MAFIARRTDYEMRHKRWSAGQYRTTPRGLVSGYTVRANIRLHRGRNSTAGRDLTDGGQVVDGTPDFVVFGK